jgi:hypothetical protein
MRRLILAASVLSLIAVPEASSQSSKAFCPIGSNDCGSSYFEADNRAKSVFELLLLDFLAAGGPERRRRTALGEIPTLPNDAAWSDIAPDETNGSVRERRAVSADLRPNKARNSWDWNEIAWQLREWGWPGIKHEKDDNRGVGSDGRSDDLEPNREGPRRSENDDNGGGAAAETPRPPNNDRPDRPDIIDQPNAEITPEPATLVLVSTGLPLAVAFIRRRRRR